MNVHLFVVEPTESPKAFRMRLVIQELREGLLKHIKGKRHTSTDSIASTPSLNGSSPALSREEQRRSIKEKNKASLKKLLLLSLRRAGINNSSKEFSSTWKSLYCACVFSLRKELDTIVIDQSCLISIIQVNMRTFNIK